MTPPESAVPVPSPCTGVCRIDAATGWCAGCRRTIEEITVWSRLDDAGKRAIWARLEARGGVVAPRSTEAPR